MLNFREWLAEQAKKEQDKDQNQDKLKDDESDSEKEQDGDNKSEEPFKPIEHPEKPKNGSLRDADKVIAKNAKEIKQKIKELGEESGTTTADVATVDNKINLVSRSLHKKLKAKDFDSIVDVDDNPKDIYN